MRFALAVFALTCLAARAEAQSCSGMDRDKTNLCYAQKLNNSEYCAKIRSSDLQWYCRATVQYRTSPSICDHVKSGSLKGQCKAVVHHQRHARGRRNPPAKITRKNGTLKKKVYVKGRLNSDGHYVKGHFVHE